MPMSDQGTEVPVDVDDLSIVLGLLALLTADGLADERLVGISDRVSARLRDSLATLTAPR